MALISADGKTTMTLSAVNNLNVKFHNGNNFDVKLNANNKEVKAGFENSSVTISVNELSNEENKIDTFYTV